MIKCDICGFECASVKLMECHKEREFLNIGEAKQKQLIRKWGDTWKEHINDGNN